MVKSKWIVLLLLLFCSSQIFAAICGDTDANGSVDIVDALIIAQVYVGLTPASNYDPAAADVNGDGTINIVDALLIAQYYVGLLDALSGCTSEPTGCSGSDWGVGDQTITLMHDGLSRRYEVHIPPGYTGTTAVPLLLVLPGAHNTPGMMRSWTKMNSVSDQNGFILVYPTSLDCWNAGWTIGAECPAADDDVGFLRTVVSDIKSHACVDPKRVYITGLSIGSVMAQYMGCHAADVFAAVGGVAGVIGTMSGDCYPSRPISVFYVHGTLDGNISNAEANAARWADRNGCSSTPVETYNVGSTRCVTYQNCDDGVEVTFCAVTGMAHCWPEDTSCLGTGNGVSDFQSSQMAWEFFRRFTLP